VTTSGKDFRQKEQLQVFQKSFPPLTGSSPFSLSGASPLLSFAHSDLSLSSFALPEEEIKEYEEAGPGWDQQ